jgi:hypothetical protein
MIEGRRSNVTNPQANPQTDEAFDASMRDLKSSLSHALDQGLAPSRTPPPAPRPVASTAPAPRQLWGPSTPRVTSPLTMLVEVADHAHALLESIRGLSERLTGEASGPRTRSPVKLPSAFLPAVAALAHEIDATHADIAQLIESLRGRL